MRRTEQVEEKAPKNCRSCKQWDEIKDKVRIRELLAKAVTTFETKINTNEYQPTVAEYVKLLQLEREIGLDDEPKEIKVTWVGPETGSNSAK